MTTAGDQIYAILVTPTAARAVSIAISAKQLAEQVDALRDTISTVENGKRMTYAFDVGLSHQVYNELFGPFDAQLRGVKHLIFEPDGAMLRLPANLLVMDQASVDAYKRRSAAGGDASSTSASSGSAATATSARRSLLEPSRSCGARRVPGRPKTISGLARTLRRLQARVR